MIKYLVNLFFILALSACISNYDTRGYVPKEEKVNEIAVGKTSKREVAEKIGYPSFLPAFEDSKWIYVETLFERKAFMDAKEIESKVLEISFNNKEVVSKINAYELDDTQKMKFSTDETPTYGHSINAVQQMIGNIGRFNKKSM